MHLLLHVKPCHESSCEKETTHPLTCVYIGGFLHFFISHTYILVISRWFFLLSPLCYFVLLEKSEHGRRNSRSSNEFRGEDPIDRYGNRITINPSWRFHLCLHHCHGGWLQALWHSCDLRKRGAPRKSHSSSAARRPDHDPRRALHHIQARLHRCTPWSGPPCPQTNSPVSECN